MGGLANIVKKDVVSAAYFTKGVVKGALKTTYAVPLMSTTYRQHKNMHARETHAGEVVGHYIGFVATGLFVASPFIALALSDGRAKTYITALAATNTLDYLVHAKKRSKGHYYDNGS